MMDNRTFPKVILHTDEADTALETFKKHHPDLDVQSCSTYEDLQAQVDQFQPEIVYALRFGGTLPYPREALFQSQSVKWVSVGGSGIDHLGQWDANKTIVTNAAGVAADMMAQYAIGGMLSFSLGLPSFAVEQKERTWDRKSTVEPIDGKTVLIVGLGKTGQAVATRSKALGLNVIGVRANPTPTENVDEVHSTKSLPNLWARADFIVICVPLLSSTRGMVDEAAFATMRENAVLIDVSRGHVVKQSALIDALDRKRIRGALLDVFEVEPLPKDNPLWNYPNVLITPHCSSVYEGREGKTVEMFCDNLSRYRSGETLSNVVLPERGY